MIVLIYGLQKSASSFVHQVVAQSLELAGHPQQPFREKLKGLHDTIGHEVLPTGLIHTRWSTVQAVMRASGDEHWHVVKTHASPTPSVIEAIEDRRIIAFATTRDLFDAALSLSEHGQLQKSDPRRKQGFVPYADIYKAIDHIAAMVPRLKQWVAVPNICRIDHSDVSGDPEKTVMRIIEHLNLDIRAADVITAMRSAEIHNFNKGVPGRFYREQPIEVQQYAENAFKAANA